MPKINSWLWFDANAQEAAEFYTSIFPNSTIVETLKYPEHVAPGESVPYPPGAVSSVEFVLDGTRFFGLNGGPVFTFSEAVSFEIECADQNEVDYYWDALRAGGGQESECGWLKDRFGLSWQVVPRRLNELVADPDPEVVRRAFEAMLTMRKIDVAALEKAVRA